MQNKEQLAPVDFHNYCPEELKQLRNSFLKEMLDIDELACEKVSNDHK